jgi:hypothetical protein
MLKVFCPKHSNQKEKKRKERKEKGDGQQKMKGPKIKREKQEKQQEKKQEKQQMAGQFAGLVPSACTAVKIETSADFWGLFDVVQYEHLQDEHLHSSNGSKGMGGGATDVYASTRIAALGAFTQGKLYGLRVANAASAVEAAAAGGGAAAAAAAAAGGGEGALGGRAAAAGAAAGGAGGAAAAGGAGGAAAGGEGEEEEADATKIKGGSSSAEGSVRGKLLPAFCIVEQQPGDVAGCIASDRSQPDVIWVHPQLRRRGFGGKLVQDLGVQPPGL